MTCGGGLRSRTRICTGFNNNTSVCEGPSETMEVCSTEVVFYFLFLFWPCNNCLRPARWLSGNAFAFGARGLRVKSRTGQLGLSFPNSFNKSCVARAQ